MASKSAAPGSDERTPLPPLIHGRARLMLLSELMRNPGGRTFTELKRAVGLTDGTLSVHLQKLEAGGLVEIRKEFVGRKPRTLARMTRGGRRAFEAYVEDLRGIVPGL
ncbi:helix-turn-helix domain-containing protein [bacterium]|nr:helix-turn-helix domain-containing protein [bacterium]